MQQMPNRATSVASKAVAMILLAASQIVAPSDVLAASGHGNEFGWLDEDELFFEGVSSAGDGGVSVVSRTNGERISGDAAVAPDDLQRVENLQRVCCVAVTYFLA